MILKDILEFANGLPDSEMAGLLAGIKEILQKRSVCPTCGGEMDGRRCWLCYESRTDLDPV